MIMLEKDLDIGNPADKFDSVMSTVWYQVAPLGQAGQLCMGTNFQLCCGNTRKLETKITSHAADIDTQSIQQN